MWDKFDLSALSLANTQPVLQSFLCKTFFADLFLILSKSFEVNIIFCLGTVLNFLLTKIFLVLLGIYLIHKSQKNASNRLKNGESRVLWISIPSR